MWFLRYKGQQVQGSASLPAHCCQRDTYLHLHGPKGALRLDWSCLRRGIGYHPLYVYTADRIARTQDRSYDILYHTAREQQNSFCTYPRDNCSAVQPPWCLFPSVKWGVRRKGMCCAPKENHRSSLWYELDGSSSSREATSLTLSLRVTVYDTKIANPNPVTLVRSTNVIFVSYTVSVDQCQ